MKGVHAVWRELWRRHRLSSRTAGQEPASTKRTGMPAETRLERRLDVAIDRVATPRGAAVVISGVTIAITALAGFLMTIIDHENFPSIGSGLWWAVQTTTTVGYGDNVPTNPSGRLLATLVMLFGIGFLTVITAAITSTFVARTRLELQKGARRPVSDDGAVASDRQAARANRSRPDGSLVTGDTGRVSRAELSSRRPRAGRPTDRRRRRRRRFPGGTAASPSGSRARLRPRGSGLTVPRGEQGEG